VDVAVPTRGREAYNFSLIAPADGTLVVRLTWDAPRDEVLQMGVNVLQTTGVGETIFGMLQLPQNGIPDLSLYSTVDSRRSLVGHVRVTSASAYRIRIASVPGYWDYGWWLDSSFTLTTSLQ
jgi:hypothetical protein